MSLLASDAESGRPARQATHPRRRLRLARRAEHEVRIAQILNMMAPYTSQIFEVVAKRPDCQLLVIYETAMEPNRRWAEEHPTYDHVVLKSWTLDLTPIVPEAYLHIPWRPLRVLRRFAPDVVVAAGAGIWSSPTNVLALAACRAHRWAFVPICESFNRQNPPLPQRMLAPWIRHFYRSGDAWLVSGTRAAERAISLGADPARTVISPMIPALPLDDGAFSTNVHPRVNERTKYLFVGRLLALKGIDVLLDAFAQVEGGELWIAGDGPLRPRVEAAAAGDNRIRLHGHLGWTELQAMYREADALVLPSLYDVWGLVVNEALAHGVPVIASDQVGAATDLLEPGVTGLVVPAGSSAALASAMREVAGWDESRRAVCAATARARVASYNPDVAAAMLIEAGRIAVQHRAART